MGQTAELELPAGIERVRRRLEKWRQKRQGREPIPERLWVAAAEQAREYGVNQTARALGLSFTKLKGFATPGKAEKRGSPSAEFLELVAAPALGKAECVIELTGRRGSVRVEWRGSSPPELEGLCRALWDGK